MPYMERLTWNGVALHAGNLPGYPASHGCIRLPLEFAKLLFGATSTTTTVVVADRSTADEQTLHPGLLLASANLEGNATLRSLPEPSGQAEWTPEKALSGPISILLSGADRTVYVYRNGVLIGRAAVSIVDPTRALAPGVFVMLEGTDDSPNRFVPGRPGHRWQAVSLPKENGELAAHDAYDRVRMPQTFAKQVYDVLERGTTLMVTDRTATGFTTTPADFTVMATEEPAPPPKR
jgi:L,D-transpeptidase catalytic domain